MDIHPKVLAASGGAVVGAGIGEELGNAVGTVTAWGLSLHGITVPDQVTGAFGVIFGAIISGVCALATGYMVSSPTTGSAQSPAEPPAHP